MAEMYLDIDPEHRDEVTKEVIELMEREKENENDS